MFKMPARSPEHLAWKHRIAGCLVFLLVCSAACCSSETNKEKATMIEQEIMHLMARLDTLDRESRDRLLVQTDEQRSALLAGLMKHVGTSSSKNVQAAAIYLIGRHRLSNGVGTLAEYIDLDAAGAPSPGPEPLWERYPAMEALINIGRPSIPGMIELLSTDDHELRRDLAVKVIRYVEDAQIATLILERADAAEADANRKARLQDALKRLRRLPQ